LTDYTKNPLIQKSEKITNEEFIVLFILMAAGTFFSGLLYFEFYFRRIGLELLSLNLPVDFFLANGMIPLCITFLLLLTAFLALGSEQPSHLVTAVSNNMLLVIAWIAFNFLQYPNLNFVGVTVLCLVCGMFITLYFAFFFPNVCFVRSLWERGFFHRIILIFMLLAVACTVSGIAGMNSGKLFIESKSPSSTVIEFSMKDTAVHAYDKENFDKKILLLIMYRNGNYYVTQFDDPAPHDTAVYIVPEDVVSLVKIKRVY
jgi:hypothetical protein